MSYSNLLRKVIVESGYNSTEIIKECNKRGRKIDKAYFSRLLNNKTQPPSEELSRIISDICQVDERKLVLEGYIDKAPNEIKEAFVSFKKMLYLTSLSLFENTIDTNILEQLEENLRQEPLADFILSLIDDKATKFNSFTNGMEMSNDNLKVILEEPLALPISDNGMFPKIIANSKVKLKIQNQYNDWDILAIKLKGSEEIIARFVLINKDKITLKPLDDKFETLHLNKTDLTILGKVTQVITDI